MKEHLLLKIEVKFMNKKDSKTPSKDKEILTEPTEYNFEKNTFIVTPVFKENSADTLGTVLLRLINNHS